MSYIVALHGFPACRFRVAHGRYRGYRIPEMRIKHIAITGFLLNWALVSDSVASLRRVMGNMRNSSCLVTVDLGVVSSFLLRRVDRAKKQNVTLSHSFNLIDADMIWNTAKK